MKTISLAFYTLAVLLLTLSDLHAQIEPIDVADLTIKVGGKEELYYGFSKGDKIVFNFEEVKVKL